MSNSSSNQSSTIFVLSLALLVTIVLAGVGAYAGYSVGYSQAETAAQVKIVEAEKKVAEAAAKSTAKRGSDKAAKPTVKVSKLKAADLGIKALTALSGKQQTEAMKALNTTMAACEACSDKGLSAAACVKSVSVCENMPKLAGRAARLAADGKSSKEIGEAIAYEEPWVRVDSSKAPVKGSDKAVVTIIEYSDFQCPYCARVQGTLGGLAKKYGDKVNFKFMHNPLSRHKLAGPAGVAALAAGEQGKFWEFHAKIFDHQRELSDEKFLEIAKDLDLDMAKFQKDLKNEAFDAQVKADQLQARKVGVRGTPTFFVNGYRLRGAKPAAFFEKIIDRELADLGS